MSASAIQSAAAHKSASPVRDRSLLAEASGAAGAIYQNENLIARLLGRIRVDANGCFNWSGARNSKGYGNIQVGSDSWFLAHRLSFMVFRGPITCGLLVLHRCDNRRCINPAHLSLGTNADNMRDAKLKGRLPPIRVKMTSDKVAEARKMLESGSTVSEVAARFNMSHEGIRGIRNGRSWKHVQV